MTYQKARILQSSETSSDTWGKIVWVQVGPPQEIPYVHMRDGKVIASKQYLIHVRETGFPTICSVSPRHVELLPEFREDVPFIPFEDWLKGDA